MDWIRVPLLMGWHRWVGIQRLQGPLLFAGTLVVLLLTLIGTTRMRMAPPAAYAAPLQQNSPLSAAASPLATPGRSDSTAGITTTALLTTVAPLTPAVTMMTATNAVTASVLTTITAATDMAGTLIMTDSVLPTPEPTPATSTLLTATNESVAPLNEPVSPLATPTVITATTLITVAETSTATSAATPVPTAVDVIIEPTNSAAQATNPLPTPPDNVTATPLARLGAWLAELPTLVQRGQVSLVLVGILFVAFFGVIALVIVRR